MESPKLLIIFMAALAVLIVICFVLIARNFSIVVQRKIRTSPENKLWEIWMSGYSATGNYAQATCLGTFPGRTFKDAVWHYKQSLPQDERVLVDLDRMTCWGCKLYDNEANARKSFG